MKPARKNDCVQANPRHSRSRNRDSIAELHDTAPCVNANAARLANTRRGSDFGRTREDDFVAVTLLFAVSALFAGWLLT
jgi:hypothetical protein